MKRISNIFWLSIPLIAFGYLIYEIAVNSFTDHFLGSDPKHIKAVIINKKIFEGNRSPSFSYAYWFMINGKEYTGNPHNTKLKVGDTVEIIYNSEHPSISKSLSPRNE